MEEILCSSSSRRYMPKMPTFGVGALRLAIARLVGQRRIDSSILLFLSLTKDSYHCMTSDISHSNPSTWKKSRREARERSSHASMSLSADDPVVGELHGDRGGSSSDACGDNACYSRNLDPDTHDAGGEAVEDEQEKRSNCLRTSRQAR